MQSKQAWIVLVRKLLSCMVIYLRLTLFPPIAVGDERNLDYRTSLVCYHVHDLPMLLVVHSEILVYAGYRHSRVIHRLYPEIQWDSGLDFTSATNNAHTNLYPNEALCNRFY